MTSAGGLVPLAEAAAHPARLLLSGPAGGVRAAAAVARRRAASSTRWRSTWAAPAPTCAWSRAGCPSPPHAYASPGSPSGCRRSRSTPSVPAVVRWRGSTPGGALVGRAARARAPIRDPRATAAAAPRPRSPTPTWCSARIPPATELPGFGRLDVAAARAALDRAGVTRRGRGRGRRRGHGAAPCAWSRSSRVSIRAISRWSRSAAPARSTPARSPTSSACATVVVPAAGRRVLGARHPLRARAARGGASRGRRPRRATGLAEARGSARRRGSPRSSRAVTSTSGSTVATQARATSCSVGEVDEFPAVHARAQRVRRDRCGGRGGRACERASPWPRRSTVADLPEPERAAARGPGGRRANPTARCGCPTGWAADAGPGRRVDRGADVNPARAADPRVPARVGGRRDGRGAPPGRVEPQHQGARRLLGGAVHRGRRAARAGRAHPRAPRFDAGVGGGRDRHRARGPS